MKYLEVFLLGLGRVQTRPEIWPAVPVFLKTRTELGLFLETQALLVNIWTQIDPKKQFYLPESNRARNKGPIPELGK